MRRPILILAVLLAATAVGLFAGLSCCTGRGPVPPYSAEIRPDAPPVFIVFGDTRRRLTLEVFRERADAERLLVIQALAAEAPAFVVNTGDLVGRGSKAGDWRTFHEENQPVFSKRIPYYPILGNHEFYGDDRLALRNYFGAFPGLRNRRWYEVRFRSVLLAALDSNFDEMEEGEIEDQDTWFADLLAAAEKDPSVRHVVVCDHHPPYTNSRVHDDSKPVQEHFVKRLTPKARVFLSGHVHSYERFEKDGRQFVVTGGGGAPLTTVNVDKPSHPDAFKGPAYRPFHYCRFTLEGEKLRADVLMLQDDRSWKRVDGFEIP
jgi:hypothetical protein